MDHPAPVSQGGGAVLDPEACRLPETCRISIPGGYSKEASIAVFGSLPGLQFLRLHSDLLIRTCVSNKTSRGLHVQEPIKVFNVTTCNLCPLGSSGEWGELCLGPSLSPEFWFFNTGTHEVQTSLTAIMWLKMTLNFSSSCLYVPSSKDIHCSAWLCSAGDGTQGFV